MRRTGFVLLVVLLLVVGSGIANAAGLAWQDHASPYTFLFKNHIDTHQQSLVKKGLLQGFFYIEYTGATTSDGVPVAMHGDCTQSPDQCVAGWSIQGVPLTAKVASVDSMGMPRWCVDKKVQRQYPGFTHFHWLDLPVDGSGLVVGQSYPGYLLQLTALDTFYFSHDGMTGTLVTPGLDTVSHNNIVTGCN